MPPIRTSSLRSSNATSCPSTRIVGELAKRSARACSAESTRIDLDLDLDRDASRLERLAHDLERRREAPVGPQSSEHRW